MNQLTIDYHASKIWDALCETYPKLVKFDCPKIVLCNRLTRTAGKCYQGLRKVHIGNKFFAKHQAEMVRVILAHEIIHQADFDLNGESEKKCGHGKKWSEMMVKYGLPANKYHSLEI